MEENQNTIPIKTPFPKQPPVTPLPPVGKPKPKFPRALIIGIILFLLIAGSAIGFYVFKQQSLKTATKPIVRTPIQTSPTANFPIGDFSVVEKFHSQSPCLITPTYIPHTSGPDVSHSCNTDIYLKDNKTGKVDYIFTTDNVVKADSDSRVPEYRNGRIFLVKRVGNSTYPSRDWNDELWVYTGTTNGKKIYEGKGFNYQSNEAGNKIAIIDTTSKNPTTNAFNNLLILISDKGNVIKKFTLQDLKIPSTSDGDYSISFYGWNNAVLRLTANLGEIPKMQIILDTNNYNIDVSQSITPTPDPTANWKTYTNSKAGFQMEYPSRYPKPELPSGMPGSSPIYADENSVGDILFGETSTDSFGVVVFPFAGSIQELLVSSEAKGNPPYNWVLTNNISLTSKDIMVDNVNAKWIMASYKTGVTDKYTAIFLVKGGYGFIIHASPNHDENEINQILSNFKFTQ